MKRLFLNSMFALAGLSMALLTTPARAGLPQPLCIFYGQARDGYGLPYRENADVILLHGTNEVARHSIKGSLSPGVNFALYVHMDDGRTPTPYSPRALRSGDSVSIVVRDQEGIKTIMESQFLPPIGRPGDILQLDVTAAQDTDGDGLPDLWEWELIASSDGALTNPWEVHGADDFDGDGMSNLDEYLAGTFAFLDYDALIAEELIPVSNHRLRLTFLSVPGITYTIHSAIDLSQTDWQPCAFALSETGPLQTTPAEGQGDWFSVYLPLDEPVRFFRLIAQ